MSIRIVYQEGDKIGDCTFLRDAPSARGNRKAAFICHCGKKFTATINNLKNGINKGCGCKQLSIAGNYQKHGLSTGGFYRSEYNIWSGMIARCYNPNNCNYKHYGAKGITVCQRWRDDVMNFINDMGYKPTPKHTLDREINTGNYEPSNCRWATYTTQARNKSNNREFEYNGETLCISELAVKYSIPRPLLATRLMIYKWDVDKAINTPAKVMKKEVTYNGETLSISQWARKTGICIQTLQTRLSSGWEIGDALTTPKLSLQQASALGRVKKELLKREKQLA